MVSIVRIRRSAFGTTAALLIVAPAQAQIAMTPAPAADPAGNLVCTYLGTVYISGDNDICDGSGSSNPTTLTIGGSGSNSTVIDGLGATFNGFNSFTKSAQFSGTQSFSGTSAFNSTVTFTGPSVTFSTPTTFNNPITANGISNTGNITTTGALSAGSASVTGALTAGSVLVGTGGMTVAAGANVSVGGNQIHNVAAGTANTDAANVGQLNAVTGNVTALQTTVATQGTQITALQAADSAFDSRVDTLELLAIDLHDRIDRVDDRASAGTAAAVALSGAMFLPGKSFNLTGNVGSYRGAHAAALQFGALVSDNVALNAGIAHGFNKGSKTALRAGFTIGW